LFREAALASVRLLQQIYSALLSKSDHTMPLEFFHDVLDEHFSGIQVQQQMEIALDWGTYSDLFTYDPATDRLQLDQPASEVDAGAPAERH
jgi:NitT/TauT family transport system ATP-binding protein